MTRWKALLAAVATAAVAAGCADEIAATVSDGEGTSSPTTPPVAEARELEPAQMCMLLTDEQRRELGLTEPGRSRMLPIRDPQCEWRTAAVRVVFSHAANGFNIDEVQVTPGDRVTVTEIGGHRARMFVNDQDPSAGCGLYIELTSTSYLEANAVTLTAGEGIVDECELARTAAAYAVGNFPPTAPR